VNINEEQFEQLTHRFYLFIYFLLEISYKPCDNKNIENGRNNRQRKALFIPQNFEDTV